MKAIKKVLAVTVALAMLLATVACSAYSPAKEYKNVELNGLKLDVRSDMKFDDTQKDASGEKVAQYYCDYFGVTVTSEAAADYKLSGCETVSDYLKAVIEANKLDSEVETSGDNYYIDYTAKVNSTEFAYTAYGFELGYNYYMVQFFAKSGEEDTYRDEYNKIVETVELAEVPAETNEIVIEGVKMTVGGDVELQDDYQYYGGQYFVSAFSNEMKGVKCDQFALQMVKIGNYTLEDGTPVTELSSIDGEIATFEYYDNNMYVYNYVKNIDSYIVYIVFSTTKPADATLMAEFEEIVKGATLA